MKQAAQNTAQMAQVSQWSMLAILLVLTLLIRLPGIERPLLGNFSTKNVVYAMIGQNWAECRAGIFFPTLDCLSGGQRSLHMLEFPVSAYLAASGWKTSGGSLDVWGRSTSVVFSMSSVALLFLFVRRRHGPEAALGAGFCLSLSPISVTYGQSFMLEASLVFFTVATFYFLDRCFSGGRAPWLAASAVCFALLLLTKVYMGVLILPLAMLVIRAKVPGRRKLAGALLLVAAILPAAAWYWHAYQTADPYGPDADRIYYSVRDSAAVHRPPHPILRSADFYRQVLDDLTGVVLTPVGLAFVLAGFLDREYRQYVAWLVAICVLVLLLPLKFHEMNYYYMAALPPLCVIAGLGWRAIGQRFRLTPTATVVLVLLGLTFSARYAGRAAFVTPHEDRAVIAAGRAMQRLAEVDEPVVTMHGTAIDLIYYCDRTGWAVAPDTTNLNTVLEDYYRQGARYLVICGPEASSPPAALGRWPVVARGPGYSIQSLSVADAIN